MNKVLKTLENCKAGDNVVFYNKFDLKIEGLFVKISQEMLFLKEVKFSFDESTVFEASFFIKDICRCEILNKEEVKSEIVKNEACKSDLIVENSVKDFETSEKLEKQDTILNKQNLIDERILLAEQRRNRMLNLNQIISKKILRRLLFIHLLRLACQITKKIFQIVVSSIKNCKMSFSRLNTYLKNK